MKNLETTSLGVIELSTNEKNYTFGGDKFMQDVGYVLGYIWGAIAFGGNSINTGGAHFS